MVETLLSGFGNYFRSEALEGALPEGRNSPQRAPFGLNAELMSGAAFTAPRHENRRTWVYRIRPSAAHNATFQPRDPGYLRTAPLNDVRAAPSLLRWDPRPAPSEPTDLVSGLFTMGANGDAAMQSGCAVHLYAANVSMERSAFYNADGEMLFVPQEGVVRFVTELGRMEARPGQIAVLPRGMRVRFELPEGPVRGYVCETYGAPFRQPELGPIGSNGLANPRDFLSPCAAFEENDEPHRLIAKFDGGLWESTTAGTPFDVVAWHGNLAPYVYDLAAFMVIGSISFDHPDPSIFTVLTSPSELAGTANVDFVIFPPRWLVAEDTFRPPWFHRNVMSEFMGLVRGVYDAKAEGFLPGGASLHNSWSAHGPDTVTHARASAADLKPQKVEDTLAFMFESRFVLRPTAAALATPGLQHEYPDCWRDLAPAFRRPSGPA